MGDQAMGTTQYVAFLRAINVGGRVVKMTELKAIFERLGLDDVTTFIASGNVIFSASAAAASIGAQIEAGLQRALGYPVATMLRSTSEVASVAEYEAFSAKTLASSSLYVGFMREKAATAAVKKALSLQTEIDELRVKGREVYWLARKNIAEASITGASIEKALQTPVTFRNINTVRRLAARYSA
jgi:uncharacterized protein (DUF1697 family)